MDTAMTVDSIAAKVASGGRVGRRKRRPARYQRRDRPGLDVRDPGAVSAPNEARTRRRDGAGVELAAQWRDFRLHPFHGGELDTG